MPLGGELYLGWLLLDQFNPERTTIRHRGGLCAAVDLRLGWNPRGGSPGSLGFHANLAA